MKFKKKKIKNHPVKFLTDGHNHVDRAVITVMTVCPYCETNDFFKIFLNFILDLCVKCQNKYKSVLEK